MDEVVRMAKKLGISIRLETHPLAAHLKFISQKEQWAKNVQKIVDEWKYEIWLLNKMKLGTNSGMLIAATLALFRATENTSAAVQFIALVNYDRGRKLTAGSDGVELLCRFIELHKVRGFKTREEVVEKTFRAFEMFENREFDRVLRGCPPFKTIAELL